MEKLYSDNSNKLHIHEVENVELENFSENEDITK